MNCSRAQAALSGRMDGERLSPRIQAAVDRHIETCATCAAFLQGAERLRAHARFRVAAAVPDLVEPIMAAVAQGRAGTPARLRPLRRAFPSRQRRPGLARKLAPAMAALLVGVVAGSASFGGPWRPPEIAAADVTRGIAEAAADLESYEARFAVTEWHLDPTVPVRELTMSVWFQAPDRFRLDVADHTQYPGDDWTPTDLSLVVDGSSSYSAAPGPCPAGVLGCSAQRTIVRNRVPFSGSAVVPTDLVLPITTLTDGSRIEVGGTEALLGHRAVRIELPFERATPLFPFLRLGGSWRPFYSQDRVVLWLDADEWFPLQYRVFPARSPERAAWEFRFGLPHESPDRAIFEVTNLHVSERTPDPATFAIPSGRSSADGGARVILITDVRNETGFDPLTPADVAGLDLYQVVLPPSPAGQPNETLITYTQGLSWLKIGETRTWGGRSLFGPVGPHAEEVKLPNGGVAYYEPATEEQGRRLSLHAAGTDLYLETNLSREELVEVAASLPVRGEMLPEGWLLQRSAEGEAERVTLGQAVEELAFPVLVPEELPPGYGLASAELVRLTGATSLNVYFQQADSALGGGTIRMHAEAAVELPPASSATQFTVEVRGFEGRWTPARAQLEWVEDGVYYSIDAPGLELVELLAMAESLGAVQ
ncbi:MAG: zf-HC2 domain-containing protein [Actinomycetota bacterium]